MEYKMEIEEECIKSLDAAIAGDHTQLDCAFAWADTPQGHSYWSQQASGITPLDIPALKEIKRQCVDTPAETGTLKELGVKAGDVVGWVGYGVPPHTLDYIDAGVYVFDTAEGPYAHPGNTPEFRIISRASDASDTPKTWGEMTYAEKGALLLAWQRGETLQYWDCDAEEWRDTDIHPHEFDADAYRVKPTPSHLPLTVGEKYELGNGQTWECIFTRDGIAWMTSYSGSTAYTFNAETGEPVCLRGHEEYNVKGPAQC